jgi:hypothetical protein
MCGPTSQETAISGEQQQFFQNLSNEYNTVFGENQNIVGALTNAFTPILRAGPSQTGFSPAEEQNLQTANTQNVATDYAQAQKATAQQLAARGGGNSLLPSSVNANILAANTNAAAAQRAAGQNQITQANYAQGYQNWQSAANALTNTAGLVNPTSYAGQVTGAGQTAMGSATEMAQQKFSPWSAALGVLGSVGGAAIGRLGAGGGGSNLANFNSAVALGNSQVMGTEDPIFEGTL